MVNSSSVKAEAEALGADLCGIAPVERFAGAPVGFRPQDIFSGCRSVIVVAKKFPPAIGGAESCVPYSHYAVLQLHDLDTLCLRLAVWLQERGVSAVSVPCDTPYEHWVPELQQGKGILSMRHAGQAAGLGVLGKNTLLNNERFGNMLHLGAVLVAADLEPDSLATYQRCPENCRRCLDACPAGALDGTTVDQSRCRPVMGEVNARGFFFYRCRRCRIVCPNSGWKAAEA